MKLNIIHLPSRVDRMSLLKNELMSQEIFDFQIWEGVIDTSPISGISKAHKNIVRYAKQNAIKEILIAEDDLRFTGKGAFEFFIKNKPLDYDLYIGGIYSGNLKTDSTVDDFSGLTFYIVNERFYDVFLSQSEEINLDRALKNQGKYFVCNPFTVIQHSGFSDNIKKVVNYDKYLIGKKLFSSSF